MHFWKLCKTPPLCYYKCLKITLNLLEFHLPYYSVVQTCFVSTLTLTKYFISLNIITLLPSPIPAYFIYFLINFQEKKKPTMSKTSNLLSEIKVIFTKHFLATKPVNNKAKEYPKACEGQRYRISFLEGDLATRTGLSFYAFVPTNSTSRNLPLRKYVRWKQNLV